MKKTTLILLLLSLPIYQGAFAQGNFGIKAGANLSNVYADEMPDYVNNFDPEMRLGYHVGIFGHQFFTEKLSLSQELLYSNKGFSTDRSILFHYINLPVLFHYALMDKLSIGVGPEIGYLISARLREAGQRIDMSRSYGNKFDFGIDLEVAYAVHESWNAGIRYNHGLTSVWDNDMQFTDENGDLLDINPIIQNRVVQFYVGYILRDNR